MNSNKELNASIFLRYLDIVSKEKHIFLNKMDYHFDLTNDKCAYYYLINFNIFKKCSKEISSLNKVLTVTKITPHNITKFTKGSDPILHGNSYNNLYLDYAKCKSSIIKQLGIPDDNFKTNQKEIAFKASRKCLFECQESFEKSENIDLSSNERDRGYVGEELLRNKSDLVDKCLKKCVNIYYESLYDVCSNYSNKLGYNIRKYH